MLQAIGGCPVTCGARSGRLGGGQVWTEHSVVRGTFTLLDKEQKLALHLLLFLLHLHMHFHFRTFRFLHF